MSWPPRRSAVLACLLAPALAWAGDTVTTPFPGLTLTARVNPSRNERLFVLKVDLCANGIAVRATKPVPNETPFVSVPTWASRVGVMAATNANFTCAGSCDQMRYIDGWIRGEGMDWGNADHDYVAPYAFGPGRVDTWNDNVVQGNFRPGWPTQIVSGHPTLVNDGVPQNNRAPSVDGSGDPLCNRNPRTAFGFSRDMRTLIMAVVDGRRAGSKGMTCNELRDLMIEFGAWNAANTDGGGSSTMWVKGYNGTTYGGTGPNHNVVNQPSDGSPRLVAAHLGIYARGGSTPGKHCLAPEPACAADPNFKTCDGTKLKVCHHLKFDEGDCAFFGVGCTTADGEARCVDARCTAGRGTRCAGGKIATCTLRADKNYDYAETACGGNQVCTDAGGPARCVDASCAGRGNGSFCTGNAIGTCAGGTYSELACTGAPCTVTATGPRCVDPRCVEHENHAFCTPTDAIATCSNGVYAEAACAEGSSCQDGPTPTCADDRCIDTAPSGCTANGGALWSCQDGAYAETTCEAGRRCVSAAEGPACVDARCIDDLDAKCTDGGTLAACSEGNYVETACAANEICSNGACVARLPDDTVAYESHGCQCGIDGGLALGLASVAPFLRRRRR